MNQYMEEVVNLNSQYNIVTILKNNGIVPDNSK
jgi:hypothetical protein